MPASPPVLTLEAVNALVPRLNALMARQMTRRADIERRLEQLAELLDAVPETLAVGDDDSPAVRAIKRELSTDVETYQSAWKEVEQMGAVLKDAQLGLVDFYGLIDGKLVWLCWKYGEDDVGHYHGLDEGFAGRKPIAQAARLRHLN